MKKKIVVDHGDQRKIAAAMGCTREMVSKSLNYAKDTTLARKIRYVAVKEYGGASVEIGRQDKRKGTLNMTNRSE